MREERLGPGSSMPQAGTWQENGNLSVQKNVGDF